MIAILAIFFAIELEVAGLGGEEEKAAFASFLSPQASPPPPPGTSSGSPGDLGISRYLRNLQHRSDTAAGHRGPEHAQRAGVPMERAVKLVPRAEFRKGGRARQTTLPGAPATKERLASAKVAVAATPGPPS